MKIKLQLSTGKEVELTESEFEELKNFLNSNKTKTVYVSDPIYIPYPPNTVSPYGGPIITCMKE